MSVTSGWGRFTWGQANWNENQILKQVGAHKSWNEDEWGDLKDAISSSLTGQNLLHLVLVNLGYIPDQINYTIKFLIHFDHKVKLLFLLFIETHISDHFPLVQDH